MRTLTDLKEAGLTVLQLCEAATNERLDARDLESICAEAAAAIRRRNSAMAFVIAYAQKIGDDETADALLAAMK